MYIVSCSVDNSHWFLAIYLRKHTFFFPNPALAWPTDQKTNVLKQILPQGEKWRVISALFDWVYEVWDVCVAEY